MSFQLKPLITLQYFWQGHSYTSRLEDLWSSGWSAARNATLARHLSTYLMHIVQHAMNSIFQQQILHGFAQFPNRAWSSVQRSKRTSRCKEFRKIEKRSMWAVHTACMGFHTKEVTNALGRHRASTDWWLHIFTQTRCLLHAKPNGGEPCDIACLVTFPKF